MIISELVLRNERLYPNKEALVFEGARWSFKGLKERVCRLSAGLEAQGIKKGDRVAVLLENCSQYIELYLGITWGGAVMLPLNFRLAERELAYIINNGQAKAVATSKNYLPMLQRIKKDLPTVEKCISIDGGEGAIDYEELVAAGCSLEKVPAVTNDGDLALLMYTSGTTGHPKGVMITHKNVTANAMNQFLAFHYIENDDITLLGSPLFHAAAASVFMAHFFAAAKSVIVDKFDPKLFLETIQKEKITNFFAVPDMINMLINYPEFSNYDMSSVRKISYAGSPMPPALLKRCFGLIDTKFIQFYGLTEATCNLTALPAEEHTTNGSSGKLRRLESVGREVLTTQVRVVDDDGKVVMPGEKGEIVAKGDSIMQGYWNLPEATTEALKDGWLHTGDVGMMDEEGYIYIVDRKKDMIISGGENIYSKEVENVIYEHPAVFEAAVIGVPDPKWGEAVMALIVLKPGQAATEQEIVDHCKQSLASYKKPRHVKFVPELPKTTTGKVMKPELRLQYGQKAKSN